MKVLQNKPVVFLILLLMLLITGIYAYLKIPSAEGFNPSDDGVILAQSYRILNGEIPHRDFISIRPAGSGFMHAIHYFSPLSLELSARWLVLFEYLIYSILITLLLTGSWFKGLRRSYLLFLTGGSVLVQFILNQNYYNLFPWTTIDSLFWFSLALYAWFRLKEKPDGGTMLWRAVMFFGIASAFLCRQTFALPGLLLLIRMLVWEIRRSEGHWKHLIISLILPMLIGFLPGWLYAGMLTATGSWPDFIDQLTGRTEFWQTGVARFSRGFWNSPVLALYGVAMVTGLIKIWNTESARDNYWINWIIMMQKTVTFLFKVILVFAVFIKTDRLFAISMAFFWLLVLDIFLIYLHDQKLPRWIRPAWWILLAAWTSSISLGDNAPVFATGMLAGTAIIMQIKDFMNRIYRNLRPYQLIAAGLLVPALFVLSLMAQMRVNYRDLPAGNLTRQGGALFAGLKGVMLSEGMYDYLSEIKRLYHEQGAPAGRFAVWPNNALIYPLLDSRNPFLLDWMQAAEFAGNEGVLMESTGNTLKANDLVILVEKRNVKWIASGEVLLDRNSGDYPYLQLLDSFARPVSSGSKWFDLYRTK